MTATRQFLLVGDPPDARWAASARKVLKTLGTLDLAALHSSDWEVRLPDYQLLFIDSVGMPDPEPLLRRLHQAQPRLPIILLTASPTWRRAKKMMLAGAANYILKIVDDTELLKEVREALAHAAETPAPGVPLNQPLGRPMGPRILIADNDPSYLESAREFLERQGYQVVCANGRAAAKEKLRSETVALALVDFRLTRDEDDYDQSGLRLAEEIMGPFSPPVIITTAYGRTEYATVALRRGRAGMTPAVDFVAKHEGLYYLLEAVERVMLRAKVFIAYGQPDRAAALRLYDQLADAGFIPWLDVCCLQGGEDKAAAIRGAIRAAHCFVVCLSHQAVTQAGELHWEIKIAWDIWDEKLEDDIYLIPVRLDECQPNLERLRPIQLLNLYDPDGLARLLTAIRTSLRRQLQHGGGL